MTQGGLKSIGVRLEGPSFTTGNALPVLHEILHGLRRFRDSREPLTIDLRAMPFGPGDEERLLEILGRGETEAGVESLGRTDIWETRYPGVWIVDYRDSEGGRIGLQVEITDIPALVRTPGDDIRDAVADLERTLAAAGAMPSEEGPR